MPPSTPLRPIHRRGARNHRQGSESERCENLLSKEKTSPKLAAMKNLAAAGWLITLAVTVFARPEPPVNQYLPPNQQFPQPQRGSDLSLPGSGSGAQYLPPNSNGYSGDNYQLGDGSNDGPAMYEFEYTVNDPDSGSDFGHKESREGSVARGVYYVLLPDGRRQTVEYEADQDGFRPRVTYTDEGSRGGNPGGNGGYAY